MFDADRATLATSLRAIAEQYISTSEGRPRSGPEMSENAAAPSRRTEPNSSSPTALAVQIPAPVIATSRIGAALGHAGAWTALPLRPLGVGRSVERRWR